MYWAARIAVVDQTRGCTTSRRTRPLRAKMIGKVKGRRHQKQDFLGLDRARIKLVHLCHRFFGLEMDNKAASDLLASHVRGKNLNQSGLLSKKIYQRLRD